MASDGWELSSEPIDVPVEESTACTGFPPLSSCLMPSPKPKKHFGGFLKKSQRERKTRKESDDSGTEEELEEIQEDDIADTIPLRPPFMKTKGAKRHSGQQEVTSYERNLVTSSKKRKTTGKVYSFKDEASSESLKVMKSKKKKKALKPQKRYPCAACNKTFPDIHDCNAHYIDKHIECKSAKVAVAGAIVISSESEHETSQTNNSSSGSSDSDSNSGSECTSGTASSSESECGEERKTQAFYQENKQIPYFKRGKIATKNITDAEIFTAISKRPCGRVCTDRILKVQEHACFLLDTSKLKDRNDFLADDNGTYRNMGSKGYIYSRDGTRIQGPSILKSTRQQVKLTKDNFVLWCTYWAHNKYSDFRRRTYEVETSTGSLYELVFLKYFFTGTQHHISPAKHKTTQKRYYPTTASTKQSIKRKIMSQTGPSDIFDQISEGSGGMDNVASLSDLPRNSNQIKKARNKVRKEKSCDNELGTFLVEARNNSFIHNFEMSGTGPRAVLASEFQIHSVVDMCCNPQDVGILGVDTTFNIGRMFFTSTVYPNMRLLHRQTGRHPHLPGPALIHTAQDANQFTYFGHSLKEMNSAIDGVLAIGCDRDKAMQLGFTNSFVVATYIYCTKHVRDDIARKLSQLKVTETDQKRLQNQKQKPKAVNQRID